MKREDLIPAEEICVRYKVERKFVRSLFDSGIIEVITIEKTEYIPQDSLTNFEKNDPSFARSEDQSRRSRSDTSLTGADRKAPKRQQAIKKSPGPL